MICDLNGRVALVTGCLGGIGRATCVALAEAGATVVGSDTRPPAAAQDWVAEVGGQAIYAQHDVTSQADWQRVVEDIEMHFGALDILVNNAGIIIVKTLEETSLEDLKRIMAVNFDGVFLGMKAAVQLMRRTGDQRPHGASIINLSSTAGFVGGVLHTAYCGSKGAVRLLTKAAAVEFSALGYKVRVNSVHPGGVKTGMFDEIMHAFVDHGFATSVDEILGGMAREHPIGRMSDPIDVARAVRYLASDEAGFMHGSELVVDGGYTAK